MTPPSSHGTSVGTTCSPWSRTIPPRPVEDEPPPPLTFQPPTRLQRPNDRGRSRCSWPSGSLRRIAPGPGGVLALDLDAPLGALVYLDTATAPTYPIR